MTTKDAEDLHQKVEDAVLAALQKFNRTLAIVTFNPESAEMRAKMIYEASFDGVNWFEIKPKGAPNGT